VSSVSDTTLRGAQPAQPQAKPGAVAAFFNGRLGRWLTALGSVGAGVAVWQLLSMRLNPLFLPSPSLTLAGAIELWDDGTLLQSIGASLARILTGWSLGLIIGVPVGILMGYFGFVRRLLDPYVEFFRFIPPIAFVTLAVIWLGPGEASKVALILYTTIFIVTLNVIAGVLSVSELRLRAAASLGAGRVSTLLSRQPQSATEHPRVVPRRVLLGRGENLAQRPVAELAVIVRNRGVGRQIAHVGGVVPRGESGGAAVEEGGDQDQPVEVEPGALLQVPGDARGPGRAVRLAAQVLG